MHSTSFTVALVSLLPLLTTAEPIPDLIHIGKVTDDYYCINHKIGATASLNSAFSTSTLTDDIINNLHTQVQAVKKQEKQQGFFVYDYAKSGKDTFLYGLEIINWDDKRMKDSSSLKADFATMQEMITNDKNKMGCHDKDGSGSGGWVTFKQRSGLGSKETHKLLVTVLPAH